MQNSNHSNPPLLSVIICTYNRDWIVTECIDSVTQQIDNSQSDIFELIIVDNNSSDQTKAKVLNFNRPYLNYIFEPKQGLSYARNTGYQAAKSEWVAYLDDDAIAKPNWLSIILEIIEHYDFDAFGGIYLPWYRDGKKWWYLDDYASNQAWMKYTERTELTEQMFSGGNCAFRKSALKAVNGFPPHLGMSGTRVAYGEESFTQAAMRERGYKLGFIPDMLIDHYVSPKKQSFSWIFKRSIASGKAYWDSNQVPPTYKNVLNSLLVLPILLARDLTFSFRKYLNGEFKAVNILIHLTHKFLFHWTKVFKGFRQAIHQRKHSK